MRAQATKDFLLTISKRKKNGIFDKITDRNLTALEAHQTDNDEQRQNPDMKRVLEEPEDVSIRANGAIIVTEQSMNRGVQQLFQAHVKCFFTSVPDIFQSEP